MRHPHVTKFLPSAWLLVLAAFGGASRYDEWQQVIVVAASVVLLAGAFLAPRRFEIRVKTTLWLFLAAVAVLMMMQLVPLPPSVWARLPGREPFLLSSELAGFDTVWRPMTLTPDLTWGALFSLLPIAATLVVAPTAKSPALRPLMWAMIGVFTVATLLGLGQSLGTDGLRLYRITNADSAIGVFANRNHHAVFLTLAFPVIAYLLATERPKNGSVLISVGVAGFVGALYIVSIIQAGSRSGLILGALMLGAVLTSVARGYFPLPAFTNGRRPREPVSARSGRLLITLGGMAAIVLVGLAITVTHSVAFRRLLQSDVTYDSRTQMLPVFMKMIEAFIPFGSGFGSFATIFRHFEPFETLNFTYLNQAHNDVIQVLIEGGLFGAALLLTAVAGWILQTVRIMRADRGPEQLVALVGCLVVGTIFLASLVDYPLRTPLLAGMLAFGSVFMLQARPAVVRRDANPSLLS